MDNSKGLEVELFMPDTCALCVKWCRQKQAELSRAQRTLFFLYVCTIIVDRDMPLTETDALPSLGDQSCTANDVKDN